MTFESNKILGGIGAILLFVGALPFLGQYSFGILSLIGLILVLVSLHGFADYYRQREIFSNALYGILAGIVGVIVTVAVAFFVVLTSLTDFLTSLGWNGDWSSISSFTPDTSNINPADVIPFLVGIALVLLVVWIFAIIATFLWRRSLKDLALKSGTGLFSTVGLLLLIGAVLLIILVGIILIYIALIVLIIAFFSMKQPETYAEPMPQAPPTTV
jgi:uncharacterized membrane protein